MILRLDFLEVRLFIATWKLFISNDSKICAAPPEKSNSLLYR